MLANIASRASTAARMSPLKSSTHLRAHINTISMVALSIARVLFTRTVPLLVTLLRRPERLAHGGSGMRSSTGRYSPYSEQRVMLNKP